jgi:hypothetical protein
MGISPDSVIELDVHMVGDKIFFRRFFCALGPCIQGFQEGCCHYLSVDPTRFNGRLCGQLTTTCGWMDTIGCTRLLSVLLTLKRRKIEHGSWSTLGGLLEIHLSWLSQVMLARG